MSDCIAGGIDIQRLPNFTFIDPKGGAERLALSELAGHVRARSAYLSKQVAAGSAIGLVHPSGPDLVLSWLACIAAGLEPLILEYPTGRQSGAHWAASIANSASLTGLRAIIADATSLALGLPRDLRIIAHEILSNIPEGDGSELVIPSFSILQLSSGTTGHRKAIRFTSKQLARHATDYNRALGLTRQDKIVSWLPLYHDMGYIACFVLPLMLDIEVVMMDPRTWVEAPQRLYDAIESHMGTLCYMPNFGYEVLMRCPPRNLPSMRLWISCSEPVSPSTARRFIAQMDLPDDAFATCYAMAENVFAVSYRRGIATQLIDGVEVVSCGRPIPGVDVREVDGELWVRGPTALRSYIGGDDIRDARGYYPTGDLGVLSAGEIFVCGRKQDLLIQAGRKFMLSDVDRALNECFSWVKGRAATLASFDDRLGTQVPLVLIEAEDFFRRDDHVLIASTLEKVTGLTAVTVHFVPPRFLSKSSSGKINRRTSLEHWRFVEDRDHSRVQGETPLAQLREQFGGLPNDCPVGSLLDSLSTVVLRIILDSSGGQYHPDLTLAAIEQQLTEFEQSSGRSKGVHETDNTIYIVSLADRLGLAHLQEYHVHRLAEALGAPVVFEHLCLPPSPILLSDLVFYDYFLPRVEQKDYAHISTAFAKLRRASVILIDDTAELYYPPTQVYGVLSHTLTRDPHTDLIAVRWQDYARRHDRLPLTFVSGADLPLDGRNQSIADLTRYLDIPVCRIATRPQLSCYTADWELQLHQPAASTPTTLGIVQANRFTEELLRWLDCAGPLRRTEDAVGTGRFIVADLPHYCSHLVDRAAVDTVLDSFDRFCIAGQQSSVPYVRHRLAEIGKSFFIVPSYAPAVIEALKLPFDCLLICGAMGNYPVTGPCVDIMSSGLPGGPVRNAPDGKLNNLQININSNRASRSNNDWFSPAQLNRNWDQAPINHAIQANIDNIAQRSNWGRKTQEYGRHTTNKNYRAAMISAISAARLAPDQSAAFRFLAQALCHLQRFRWANMAAEHAVDIDPDDAYALDTLATVRIAVGDFAGAEIVLIEALKREPSLGGSQYRMSIVLGKQGRFDDAMTFICKALQNDNTAPHFHIQKINLLMQSLSFGSALQACLEGLEALPGHLAIIALARQLDHSSLDPKTPKMF